MTIAEQAPVDRAEAAFHSRLVGDQQTLVLLRDERPIVWGHPLEVLDDPDTDELRWVSYFGMTGPVLRPGIADVRIQADIVFPIGENDALGKVDRRLVELFFEERWTHQGERFHGVQTSWRQAPPLGERRLQRTREFLIKVDV